MRTVQMILERNNVATILFCLHKLGVPSGYASSHFCSCLFALSSHFAHASSHFSHFASHFSHFAHASSHFSHFASHFSHFAHASSHFSH
jgi:hypothetical protein